jgi:hypothetical protein
MATKRQIEANRLNAQKSTGPRTPEGKARSSMNGLKSGLDSESQFVYGEDPQDFGVLHRNTSTNFSPSLPKSVSSLIRSFGTNGSSVDCSAPNRSSENFTSPPKESTAATP